MSASPRAARDHIAFAADATSFEAILPTIEAVKPHVGVLKVGLELFTHEGPRAVKQGRTLGLDVFLDLKLHDIPETVERAVGAAAALGARFLTVHASGGPTMLSRAVDRAARESGGHMMVVAVTVLTSLDQGDLEAIGVRQSLAEQAVALARMAWQSGVRGFVCSPLEVAALRRELGSEAFLITPGVRPGQHQGDDQKRVATASEAISRGSSLLVVGRPLRDAADPRAVAAALEADVGAALGGPR